MCSWDQLPYYRLPAIVVGFDVRRIYQNDCIQHVLLSRFREPITHLSSADLQVTIWLPLVGLYSGPPKIVLDLLL